MAENPKESKKQDENTNKKTLDIGTNETIILTDHGIGAEAATQWFSSPSGHIILNTEGIASSTFFTSSGYLSEKSRELEQEKRGLELKILSLSEEYQKAKISDKEKSSIIEQLQSTITQLSDKEKLSFLLTRVKEDAQKLLLESEDFRKQFIECKECNAFVMSVDIRRSTELMSKARTPQKFAYFMTTLCKELENIIKDNYGVFDKFTGDGVLAFFPEFYSGDDGGFYVVSAAERCHKVFREKYKEFRSSFISVLTGVGLGIGIDYGPAHLVQMAGGLTVVGAPVVYACRMSGAPAGTTLLNQPGYEKISERFSAYCFFRETELEIKNEGSTLAYQIQLNGKDYKPSPPSWVHLPGNDHRKEET